ncbi:hypothetical protein DENSPDRAFT_599409 [Dentipellis sp. KUC8613]|nr:hypothetical protein DENSPDRAFT_599409 [Dentipellis sp. KUC8613]
MAGISPISNAEFLHMMQRCLPPKGWSSKFAVAHSGGADSTCLLFLLRRLAREFQRDDGPKLSFTSFHVNHELQPASVAMAQSCAQTARELGVGHRELRIPWGTPPYPPRPGAGDAVEATARSARYHILFQAMKSACIGAIAFGHHADDQVETALMRLAKGSKEFGLAGMRPIRRWGMGFGQDKDALGWAGYEGMRHYIVRPLLDVSKDRILATCEENKLHYVEDPSNFQPELTSRNAIRQVLESPEVAVLSPEGESPPKNIVMAQKAVDDLVKMSESLLPFGDDRRDQLRDVVRLYRNSLDLAESTATSVIRSIRVASPPATFLLAHKRATVPDDEKVRSAIVLRILRYISSEPWGSAASQCHRRSSSILSIAQRIWDTDTPFARRLAFTAGAQVQWTPVRICQSGKLKFGAPREGDRVGWIASRMPAEARKAAAVYLDITDALRAKLKYRKDGHGPGPVLRMLYDNRFFLTFHLDRIDPWTAGALLEGEGRVKIVPDTRWSWPRIVWERDDDREVVLGGVVAPEMQWRNAARSRKSSDWIDVHFVRTLDDI